MPSELGTAYDLPKGRLVVPGGGAIALVVADGDEVRTCPRRVDVSGDRRADHSVPQAAADVACDLVRLAVGGVVVLGPQHPEHSWEVPRHSAEERRRLTHEEAERPRRFPGATHRNDDFFATEEPGGQCRSERRLRIDHD